MSKSGTLVLLLAHLALAQEPSTRPSSAESRSVTWRQFYGLYAGEAKIGSGAMERTVGADGAVRISFDGSVDVRLAPDRMPVAYGRAMEFDPSGNLREASETIETEKPVTNSVIVEETSVRNGPKGAVWRKAVSRKSAGSAVTKVSDETKEGPALKLTCTEHERDRAWIKGGAAPGGTSISADLDLAARKVRTARLRLLRRIATRTTGIPLRTAICVETDDAQQTAMLAFDAEGTPSFLELPNGWLARAEPDGRAQSAIGWDGCLAASVMAATALSAPGATKKVDLELGGKALFLVESDIGRELKRRGDGLATLQLDLDKQLSLPLGPADRRKWIEADAEVASTDHAIVSFAKEAAGQAAGTTDQDRVKSLISAAREVVSDRPIAPGLSAVQILDYRRGGARGRSLLVVAAARALKIPAREVRGLAYRTQDPRLFIPHSWVEIEIEGRWVPVDPTFGQVPADVFRIRCRPLQPGDLIPDPSGVLTVDLKR